MTLQETVSQMMGREVTKEEAQQLADDQFGRLVTYLREEYGRNKCIIEWNTEDIKEVDNTLSEEQALIVLKRLEHKHDANYGIGWDTIRDTITILRMDEVI